jgi:hypothetical protein
MEDELKINILNRSKEAQLTFPKIVKLATHHQLRWWRCDENKFLKNKALKL